MAATGDESLKQKKRTADDNVTRLKHSSKQSRMDLSKADMLQLLSHLETELQARDLMIATLKAEKAKHFLYQAKYGRFSLSDPVYAQQREAEESDRDAAMRAMCDDPLTQLDKLITTQHEAQRQMKEQLAAVDKRFYKVCVELEEEKWKYNHDLEQGDSVVFMLEKDRERLRHEVELEKNQNNKVEAEVQSVSSELVKSARYREVVLKLIKKRSQIMKDIAEVQYSITSLEEKMQQAETEAKGIQEHLSEECSKVLHIEAVAERQLGAASIDREQLLSKLSFIERQNQELCVELEKLRVALRSKHGGPAEGVATVHLNRADPQTRHMHVLTSETRILGVPGTSDVKLQQSKVTLHTPSPGVMPQARVVADASRTVILPEMVAGQKIMGGHQVLLAKHTASEIRAPPPSPSVELSLASLPGEVSTGVALGSRSSLATSGPRRQAPPVMMAVRGVPPPVPPNKPQVSLTQVRLQMAPASSSAASRVIPTAQPLIPQPQVKYGIALSQDRTATPDKPALAAGGVTSSRQPPANSSQTGASHMAMVVGETSTVHKHPSQVCVNIK